LAKVAVQCSTDLGKIATFAKPETVRITHTKPVTKLYASKNGFSHLKQTNYQL
jgi:hypothetical protein